MEFSILGPLEVRVGGSAVPIGGPRQQALLALLLVRGGRPVHVEQIVDELWGETPPATATKTVRSYVSRLRKLLGEADCIVTEGATYRVVADDDQLDSLEFESLLELARGLQAEGAHPAASEHLKRALRLWRGRALEGLEDHPFAQLESARLHERRLEALEARIESDLELGRHRQLTAELDLLVKEHPLREGMWRALMLSLYRSSRQAEALRTFQEARRVLGEELGLEPSPELRDLEESILLHDETIAVVTTERAREHNLPEPRDRFIGRESELARIAEVLGEYRCATLTGVGGSGKTRLAIEATRAAASSFTAGVRFVELATITDAGTLAEHVLLAFGVPGSHSEDVAGALAELIGAGGWLLVLDNCEHLIRPVAGLVDRLLGECPNLKVLATSREVLGVDGEAVVHVLPLGLPQEDDSTEAVAASEAVRLLADRIQMHHHDFAVTETTRDAVVTICLRLDGIPLALELAAARARTLSLADIAKHLDDRFELLTQGSRTALPRQQTLKATIDWSYDLLSPEAARTLRRLAAFGGSWTGSAAHAVVSDPGETETTTLDLLSELVDKSLVEPMPGGSRYRLLETVRQYGFDGLVTAGEAHETGRRHRDWYADLAAEAAGHLRGPEQRVWWERLESEHDNLRAALEWSFGSGQHDAALDMIAALGWFWMMRGYWPEAWRWLTRGLAAGGTPAARAAAILGVGVIEIVRVNADPVVELFEEAEQTCRELGDESGLMWSRYQLGLAAWIRGDESGIALADEASSWFERAGEEWAAAWARFHRAQLGMVSVGDGLALDREALEVFERRGDSWTAGYVRFSYAAQLLEAGEVAAAKETAAAGRSLARDQDDRVWEAHSTRVLAAAELADGNPDRAHSLFGEALHTFRVMGDDSCQGTCLWHLGLIEARAGDLDAAANRARTAIVTRWRLGSRPGLAVCLVLVGLIALRGGDQAAAGRFGWRAVTFLREVDLWEEHRRAVDALDEGLHAELGTDALLQIEAEVSEVSIDDLSREAAVWCEKWQVGDGNSAD